MKTLFVLLFFFADGKMEFALKQFDDTPACVEHLERISAAAATEEANAALKAKGVVNVAGFCTTKMRAVDPSAIPAGLRPSL